MLDSKYKALRKCPGTFINQCNMILVINYASRSPITEYHISNIKAYNKFKKSYEDHTGEITINFYCSKCIIFNKLVNM